MLFVNQEIFILPPPGIRSPADPKGPLLYHFPIPIFSDGPQKISKGAFGGQYNLYLRVQRAPKNANFWSKFCSKVPTNALFGLFFFKVLPAAPKQGQKVLERARKINLVDLKKKIVFESFLKIRPPPPRENPRSATVSVYMYGTLNCMVWYVVSAPPPLPEKILDPPLFLFICMVRFMNSFI